MISRRHQRSCRGFVLAELCIAMLVVTAVLAGVIGMASQCLRVVGEMKNELTATQVAQSEMEKLRVMPWSSIRAIGNALELDPEKIPLLKQMQTAKAEVSVTPAKGSEEGAGLVAVTVRVTWLDRRNKSRELALSSLIAERLERPK